jgi:hypothetical protein
MTKRKTAAEKAHSTYRKSAPEAAAKNARSAYRKTSAQFEEFIRDAQVPESMRTLAEKSVAQTRELCEHSLEAVLGVGRDSSMLVRAPWRSTVRRSTLLGTISIPVSVLR